MIHLIRTAVLIGIGFLAGRLSKQSTAPAPKKESKGESGAEKTKDTKK